MALRTHVKDVVCGKVKVVDRLDVGQYNNVEQLLTQMLNRIQTLEERVTELET